MFIIKIDFFSLMFGLSTVCLKLIKICDENLFLIIHMTHIFLEI